MTATNKVLFVDDEANVLASFTRRLGKQFDITTALSGSEGLEVLERQGPFAVVISDQRMPGMDGIEFLGEVKFRSPDTVRMMLTGNTDLDTAIKAVNKGAIFRFFTKPCPPEDMATAIDTGLKQYNLVTAERELLERTLAGSIKVLVDVLSLADPVAFQKTQLLRNWAGMVARRMKLDSIWELDIAAMLAPIGLITVPDGILGRVREGEPLTETDRQIYERAPEAGKNLISNIPRMQDVAKIILYQNKGFDGSGFPDDWVAGKEIPFGARVLKILLDLSEVTDRPDKASFEALRDKSALYDPEILSTVRACFVNEGGDILEKIAGDADKIKIVDLRPGHRLVSNIETEDGLMILAAGIEITNAQLERIWNLHKVRKLKEPVYVVGVVA